MKKCFAINSTVTVSWFKGTGAEFVDASKEMKTYAPHKLYNTVVCLNNNKAVAITAATIQCRTNLNGFPVELQSDVKLMYKVQKKDSVWHIVSLDAIYVKDLLVPCYPECNITIPIEEISEYRPSYANLSYVFSKEGYEINAELPGIDRPETVNKLYREAEEWLFIE